MTRVSRSAEGFADAMMAGTLRGWHAGRQCANGADEKQNARKTKCQKLEAALIGNHIDLKPCGKAAPAFWPPEFFDRIAIDDPAFARPRRGRLVDAGEMAGHLPRMSITVIVENDTIRLPVHVPDGTSVEVVLPGERGVAGKSETAGADLAEYRQRVAEARQRFVVNCPWKTTGEAMRELRAGEQD
jgi:hypothetical protein